MSQLQTPQIHEREAGINPDGSDRFACTGNGVVGFGSTMDGAYSDYEHKLRVKQLDEACGGEMMKKLSDIEKIENIMIEKGWREKGQTEPPLPEAVGLLIDLVMGLQETKQTLRQRLLECGVVA